MLISQLEAFALQRASFEPNLANVKKCSALNSHNSNGGSRLKPESADLKEEMDKGEREKELAADNKRARHEQQYFHLGR